LLATPAGVPDNPAGVDPNALEAVDADRWLAPVATAHVLTLEGERVRLREYWRDAPVVTGFLRHYGCLFCHQMVEEVVKAVPDIVAKGARVVLIGNGTVEQAAYFFGQKNLPTDHCHVVTDPERETYKAAELQRGYVRTFFDGRGRSAYKRARAEGHQIGGLFGDLIQLGGVLVTRPPARFVFLHRSEFAGDHPNMSTVLDAVVRARS
jgi:hypothetical protein